MSDETQKSAPSWFKVVAIIAIIWNLLGVLSYLMQVMMPAEALAMMPEKQRMIYETIPTIATIGYALAVWAGISGSIGLAMKKSWSIMLLMISLLGVLIQQITSFFFTDILEVIGVFEITMSVLVLVVAVFLLKLAGQGKSEGWIK